MSEQPGSGAPEPYRPEDAGSSPPARNPGRDRSSGERAPAPQRGAGASPHTPPGPPRPKRTSAQIRADMDRQREDLGQSVDALRDRVTEITDWRSQIKKHRRSIVVGAVATGFVVGGLMALRRR